MRKLIVLWLVLLGGCGQAVVPGSPEACAVHKVTEVPLIPPSPPATTRWSIAMTLDGKPVTMMLDSGATGLMIDAEVAARLGLRQRSDMRAFASGLGGTVYRRVFEVVAVGIGSQVTERDQIIIEMTESQAAGRGFDGIVGMRAFERNDIEIDFPARTMRLYRARFCPAGSPPWPAGFGTFPRAGRQSGDNRPMVAVTLDGRTVKALVDTGATTTVVDHSFAKTVGARDAPPPGARQGTMRTMSEATVPMWQHRFGAADIVGLRFPAPNIWILDLGMTADMVVGLDILARTRIWISNGSDAVYVARGGARGGAPSGAPGGPPPR